MGYGFDPNELIETKVDLVDKDGFHKVGEAGESSGDNSYSVFPFIDFYYGDPDDGTRQATLIINCAEHPDNQSHLVVDSIKYFFDDDEENLETVSNIFGTYDMHPHDTEYIAGAYYISFYHFDITDYNPNDWSTVTVIAYNDQNEEIGRVTVPNA